MYVHFSYVYISTYNVQSYIKVEGTYLQYNYMHVYIDPCMGAVIYMDSSNVSKHLWSKIAVDRCMYNTVPHSLKF